MWVDPFACNQNAVWELSVPDPYQHCIVIRGDMVGKICLSIPPPPNKKQTKQNEQAKREGQGKGRGRNRGGSRRQTRRPTHTRPPPRPANPTPHVPHPSRNRQAEDHPPSTTTTDRHEKPPRTTHDAPPPTTRTTPTQAPPAQPAAPPPAARQHTMVPPWMRYTPKTPSASRPGTTTGRTKGTPRKTPPQ